MDFNYGFRITHSFSVVNDANDDMVIRRDLLSALEVIVNLHDGIVE